MQLIMETESPSVNIQEKMSTLDEVTFADKPIANGLRDFIGEGDEKTESNGNKENGDKEHVKSKVNIVESEENNVKDSVNNITDIEAIVEKNIPSEENKDQTTEKQDITETNFATSPIKELKESQNDIVVKENGIEHEEPLVTKNSEIENVATTDDDQRNTNKDANKELGVSQSEVTPSINSEVNETLSGLHDEISTNNVEIERIEHDVDKQLVNSEISNANLSEDVNKDEERKSISKDELMENSPLQGEADTSFPIPSDILENVTNETTQPQILTDSNKSVDDIVNGNTTQISTDIYMIDLPEQEKVETNDKVSIDSVTDKSKVEDKIENQDIELTLNSIATTEIRADNDVPVSEFKENNIDDSKKSDVAESIDTQPDCASGEDVEKTKVTDVMDIQAESASVEDVKKCDITEVMDIQADATSVEEVKKIDVAEITDIQPDSASGKDVKKDDVTEVMEIQVDSVNVQDVKESKVTEIMDIQAESTRAEDVKKCDVTEVMDIQADPASVEEVKKIDIAEVMDIQPDSASSKDVIKDDVTEAMDIQADSASVEEVKKINVAEITDIQLDSASGKDVKKDDVAGIMDDQVDSASVQDVNKSDVAEIMDNQVTSASVEDVNESKVAEIMDIQPDSASVVDVKTSDVTEIIDIQDGSTSIEIKDHVTDVEEVKNNEAETEPQKQINVPKQQIVEKELTPVITLSNTLDILSDDEDEPPKKETESNVAKPSVSVSADKQCITLDDDDDIMLIDDEDTTTTKAPEKEVTDVKVSDAKADKEITTDTAIVDLDNSKEDENKDAVTEIRADNDSAEPKTAINEELPTESSQAEKIVEVDTEKQEKPKPLVPDDFFKTYRKNLTDMTRDDLEEFCILKIVESIIDRSNLNDIRTKLKTMAQSIEEYKKKAMMLTKQNRDLQVVLKSVQEEQKKVTDQPIAPLKITRSVGMQVLMTEKNRRRPVPGPANAIPNFNVNSQPNNVNNRPGRNTTPRVQKQTQQIPVPRLVPAANKTTNAVNQGANNIAKPTPIPNGLKASPVQKTPEKRTHSRMQSQSVTVDLTDDEPPSKLVTKNSPAPPVRLVSPQNLIAPRQAAPNYNSPRKVYIPIGGPGQAVQSVRAGQTIMLKTVSTQGPRGRGTSAPMVRLPQNTMQVRRIPGARHPAPLPDAMKQYQPPNWKSLPPAPDLKLSKVENGIVISWKIEGYQEDSYEEIASYQLYAYQETSAPPSTALWKKIGDVKALPLPMACTLTQFMAGYKYYFAVRAVDIRSRLGPFSLPGSILLVNKM